ncbi:disintegrin and metalloproteinase domain-containing protein 10-like isoform X2 [Asterias amurensis]|uniref:disintegrin and metalloproteinase domain-containing protein 10-like isoform X2 n=1 Tax=Asterias amurensis TaxID=7602 RepID=UPI003AB67115
MLFPMPFLGTAFVFLLLRCFQGAIGKDTLNEVIRHFEPLNYDTDTLIGLAQPQCQINKSPLMSQNEDALINWEVSAFGRSFHLQLSLHHDIISKDAKLTVVKTESTITKNLVSNLYRGILKDDEHSSIHGHIINGTFDGIIKTSNETYHLEPSARFLNEPEFHSVIYRATDIQINNKQAKAGPCQLCSVTFAPPNSQTKDVFKKIIKNSIDSSQSQDEIDGSNARERQTEFDQTAKTCELYIVIDHTFFKEVADSDVSMAIAEVAFHIAEADSVYRATDFDADGIADNVGLAIGGATIFESESAQNYLISQEYQDAYRFLSDFSLYDFSSYCMGLAFTYRDFNEGILGLAWMGYPGSDSPPGGICQKQVVYMDEGQPSSLNTAIVTLLNFGVYMPRSVSVTSVLHELGHGFGSEHDPQSQSCSPSGSQGNYIMYSQATDGNRPNNDRFSSCSRSQIAAMITSKGHQCLKSQVAQYCGNGLVEDGEECDCGSDSMCAYADNCCTPKGGLGTDPECTFRRQLGRVCSPLTSKCCDSRCHLIPATWYVQCSSSEECQQESFCNGSSAVCPQSESQPDGSRCDGDVNRCFDGQCVLGPCYDLGLQDCLCNYDVNNPQQSCQLCCQVDSECVPAVSLGLVAANGDIIQKQPGSVCHAYTGYCDLKGDCVTLDTDSALDKLKNLFTKTHSKDVAYWLYRNWYYLVCGVLSFGIVSLMVRITRDYWGNMRSAVRRIRENTSSTAEHARQEDLNQDSTTEPHDAATTIPTVCNSVTQV